MRLNYSSLVFFVLILVGCQSKSPIVTSKNEAVRRGIYDADGKRNPQKAVTHHKEKQAETHDDRVVQSNSTSTKEPSFHTNANRKFSEQTEINNLILTAFEYEGVRYRGGGTTPEGMDCSGLVFRTFSTYDIILPRSSHEMATVGRKLKNKDIRPGDLVFFKTNGRSRINHVGLVTEVRADEILFIHSSTQRGVIVSSTKEPYYSKSFIQANRIIE